MKAAALAIALLALSGCARRPDPMPGAPRLFLWAWQNPEHLTFIDPRQTGVAFLARTVSWRNGDLRSQPRFQPLQVPPGTAVIAVVRLEGAGAPPGLDAAGVEILKAAALPRIRALQIDFDALASERAWYAGLLKLVRSRLDAAIPLTITALASWCLGDPWIRNLPVGDAIPMMFRMGTRESIDFRDYSLSVCRSSLGISTDEAAPRLPHGRRIFVFHPGPWTPEAYHDAMQMARRLQ